MADNFSLVQSQKHVISGSGISATATSIVLQSFQTPDGTNITISDFGTAGYATLEPGTSREESIKFTGVTQNVDGTATLTGVTRGLKFVSPYTEDSNLKQPHSGGAVFVLSNTSAMYDQFIAKDDDGTVSQVLTFTVPNFPEMSDTTPPTGDTQLATKKYIDDSIISGAPDATETVKGIVEISTQAEIDAGAGTGGTGAKLVISPDNLAASIYGTQLPSSDEKAALVGTSGTPATANKYVTNDDTAVTATADKVVRADGSNKIDEGYLNISNANATTLTDGSDADALHVHEKGYDSDDIADLTTSTTGNNDVTVVTGFLPRRIVLHYYVQGKDETISSGTISGAKGIATYQGITLKNNTYIWKTSDTNTVKGMSADDGNPLNIEAFINTINGGVPTTGVNGSAGSVRVTLSINSVSSTGFVLRRLVDGTPGANVGRAKIWYEAFE